PTSYLKARELTTRDRFVAARKPRRCPYQRLFAYRQKASCQRGVGIYVPCEKLLDKVGPIKTIAARAPIATTKFVYLEGSPKIGFEVSSLGGGIGKDESPCYGCRDVSL